MNLYLYDMKPPETEPANGTVPESLHVTQSIQEVEAGDSYILCAMDPVPSRVLILKPTLIPPVPSGCLDAPVPPETFLLRCSSSTSWFHLLCWLRPFGSTRLLLPRRPHCLRCAPVCWAPVYASVPRASSSTLDSWAVDASLVHVGLSDLPDTPRYLALPLSVGLQGPPRHSAKASPWLLHRRLPSPSHHQLCALRQSSGVIVTVLGCTFREEGELSRLWTYLF